MPDQDWTQPFTKLYDYTDPNDRILYQLAHGNWTEFLRLKWKYIAALRASEAPGHLSGDPVPGARRKYADMCAFLQGETDGIDNEWVEVEEVLGISWPDQCRVLSPARDEKSRRQFLMLMRMDIDDRIEFEQAARAGASLRKLAERWQLGYHLVRRIVLMFGRHRDLR